MFIFAATIAAGCLGVEFEAHAEIGAAKQGLTKWLGIMGFVAFGHARNAALPKYDVDLELWSGDSTPAQLFGALRMQHRTSCTPIAEWAECLRGS
jgi:hypothetical protein